MVRFRRGVSTGAVFFLFFLLFLFFFLLVFLLDFFLLAFFDFSGDGVLETGGMSSVVIADVVDEFTGEFK